MDAEMKADRLGLSYGTIPQHREDAIVLELASLDQTSNSSQQAFGPK
jgi:hypothetical protein